MLFTHLTQLTVCSSMSISLLVLAGHLFIFHSVVTAVASHSQMIVEEFVKCTKPRQQRDILLGITFYCSVEERCKVLTLFFLFFFKQILGIVRCLGWGLAIVPSQILAITLSQTTCWAVHYLSLISCHPIETLHYHIPSIREQRCCMKTAITLLTPPFVV